MDKDLLRKKANEYKKQAGIPDEPPPDYKTYVPGASRPSSSKPSPAKSSPAKQATVKQTPIQKKETEDFDQPPQQSKSVRSPLGPTKSSSRYQSSPPPSNPSGGEYGRGHADTKSRERDYEEEDGLVPSARGKGKERASGRKGSDRRDPAENDPENRRRDDRDDREDRRDRDHQGRRKDDQSSKGKGKSRKNYSEDSEEERPPPKSKGKRHEPSSSEGSEEDRGYHSEDNRRALAIRKKSPSSRHSKSKKGKRHDEESTSEDESSDDHRRNTKSKALVHAGSSKKASGRRQDRDSDEEEVIQVQRYEPFGVYATPPQWLDWIVHTFKLPQSAFTDFVHKGWIQVDKKKNLPHIHQKMLDLYPDHVKNRWQFALDTIVESREKAERGYVNSGWYQAH
jgi:hypothetical protein